MFRAVCAFAVLTAISAAADPNIWPLPQSYSSGTTTYTLASPFKFQVSPASAIIDTAFKRYTDLIFGHRVSSATGIGACTVQLASTTETVPQYGTDESYTLTVDATGAAITANTVYGAMYGLETFSQLVKFNFDTQKYEIANGPWKITDSPRFGHRGLLIDTSRHFQPVSVIKDVIRSLSYAKLNVLHWHVVDTQSFPLQVPSQPKLWQAAYSAQERYTVNDVADVVEYGRLHGVRVMIEFDVPGHAGSWCVGYPNVCPSATCTQPLDPSTNDTFNLLTNLWKDMTGGVQYGGMFPENFVHLGGDEVDTSCWTSTPRIASWLSAMNYTADQAYMYFVNRAQQIVMAQGRIPINWVEVFEHFGSLLDKRTVIHVWKAKSSLAKVVAAGYKGLLSDSDLWYLDNLQGTWITYYNNEPLSDISDPTQQSLVIGGQACMWGETVDPSDMHNTVWPRTAAVAERLWSPRSVTDVDKAHPRLQEFRCLLTRRGIGAAPVNNANARTAPPNPGGCLTQ